ncbi:MAG: ParB/RepB/Spo0J family partition protein [Alphaproteobacteria bacterium]|jgi:ParB family chromosome partitioning protein|nr:ParB/RepB/Spo0J family partition protein [Alphaproteobacteria bacterium]
MTPRDRALGKGLDALLGAPPEAGAPRALPIETIVPGSVQPRRRFDSEDIAALAESIRQRGVIQPILVRPDPDRPERYQIVAGERRWRAAQKARIHEIPVVIRTLSDQDALEIALIENIQRTNLTPLEEADGYRRLIDDFGFTQESLARHVGKSRSHVANTVRLLVLPESVRSLLDNGRLSAGHGRALLVAVDPENLAKLVVNRDLNVRQTERLATRAPSLKDSPLPPVAGSRSADVAALESELSAHLGLKVEIADRGEKGAVRIVYKTLEQLDEIIRKLRL